MKVNDMSVLLGCVYLEYLDVPEVLFDVHYSVCDSSLVCFYRTGGVDRLDYRPISIQDAILYLEDRYCDGCGYVFKSCLNE